MTTNGEAPIRRGVTRWRTPAVRPERMRGPCHGWPGRSRLYRTVYFTARGFHGTARRRAAGPHPEGGQGRLPRAGLRARLDGRGRGTRRDVEALALRPLREQGEAVRGG